jgi:hypothetical protein
MRKSEKKRFWGAKLNMSFNSEGCKQKEVKIFSEIINSKFKTLNIILSILTNIKITN